jgi:hypothetical protein
VAIQIEGIKLYMSSTELSHHALKRADFHAQRAEAYSQKVAELRDMRKDNPAPSFDDADESPLKNSFSNSYGHTDPITTLEAQARSHRSKSERFRFIAAHTVAGAEHILDLGDLTTLEIGA